MFHLAFNRLEVNVLGNINLNTNLRPPPSEHSLRGAVFIRWRLHFVENLQSMAE